MPNPYPSPHTCSLCGKEGYYLIYTKIAKPYGNVRVHPMCLTRYKLKNGYAGKKTRGRRATTQSINHDNIRNSVPT